MNKDRQQDIAKIKKNFLKTLAHKYIRPNVNFPGSQIKSFLLSSHLCVHIYSVKKYSRIIIKFQDLKSTPSEFQFMNPHKKYTFCEIIYWGSTGVCVICFIWQLPVLILVVNFTEEYRNCQLARPINKLKTHANNQIQQCGFNLFANLTNYDDKNHKLWELCKTVMDTVTDKQLRLCVLCLASLCSYA